MWTSLKYHFQPSVPTGGVAAVAQSMGFYVLFAAAFFCVGGYLYMEALRVWFRDTYHLGWDVGLLMGAGLFWGTVYLLRFGLFVLLATVASAFATFPLKTLVGLAALAHAGLHVAENPVAAFFDNRAWLTQFLVLAGLALALAEPEILRFAKGVRNSTGRGRRRREAEERALAALRADPDRAFGLVYMSGDDLSFLKLTPELMMTRLRLLRDKLDSSGLKLLATLVPWPEDAAIEGRFRALYEAERGADVTLWHPCQLVASGQRPALDPALGLGIAVAGETERAALLATWHLRRWLVTMMSTAGHAQDTGINLVDLALRVQREGLGANAVFYLIQNKYDDAAHNRPAQVAYDRGELGQRNKLARSRKATGRCSRA